MIIECARKSLPAALLWVGIAFAAGCGGRSSPNLSPVADEESESYRNVRAETEALHKAQAEAEKRAFQKLKPVKTGP